MNGDLNVAELRRLEQAATPAPWEVDDDGEVRAAVEMGRMTHVLEHRHLIVAMRNALPSLLDLVEELTRERDEARARGDYEQGRAESLLADLHESNVQRDALGERYTAACAEAHEALAACRAANDEVGQRNARIEALEREAGASHRRALQAESVATQAGRERDTQTAMVEEFGRKMDAAIEEAAGLRTQLGHAERERDALAEKMRACVEWAETNAEGDELPDVFVDLRTALSPPTPPAEATEARTPVACCHWTYDHTGAAVHSCTPASPPVVALDVQMELERARAELEGAPGEVARKARAMLDTALAGRPSKATDAGEGES